MDERSGQALLDDTTTGSADPSRLTGRGKRGQPLLLLVAFAAIALGIFARIDSLDRKILWRDESFSLLRISGHSERALYALFDGRVHTSGDLAALTRASPSAGLRATLTSLHEEPQRGPLYYLMARIWVGIVGDDTVAVRAFSAALGILGIAIGFALGRRLTETLAGGLVLAALVALSPIDIRFSQQVREYIFVADLTLLSSLLLLRAIHRSSTLRWLGYGLCTLAGLYTNVTFGCVIIAQGLVVLSVGFGRGRLLVRGFIPAVASVALLFAPWAYAASRAAGEHASDLSWAAGTYSLKSTAMKWAFNIGAVFFDSEYAHLRLGVLVVPLLAITGVAVVRAIQGVRYSTSRKLALAITFSTIVPLTVSDTLYHSHLALVARYEMPAWFGILMLVTLLVEPALRSSSAISRTGAIAAFAVALIAGATSVFVDRPFTQWWDNNDHLSERDVALAVLDGPQPALVVANVADDNAYDTFVLSRYLPTGTPMLLLRKQLGELPSGYAATYFFTPSERVLERAAFLEHAPPRNVSPRPEFAVPELSEARRSDTETVVYGNALWKSTNEYHETHRHRRRRAEVAVSSCGHFVRNPICVPISSKPDVSPQSDAWARVNFQPGRDSLSGLIAKSGSSPFDDGSRDNADPPYELVTRKTATTPQIITCDAVPWAAWTCRKYGVADKVVNVPTDMEPAGNTDHHFSFGSTTLKGEFDFWLVQSRIQPPYGRLHVGGGGFCAWSGDGTACSGSNATNIAETLGSITAADFFRGEADEAHGTFGHAIAFSVLCADPSYVWPANASDGKNTDRFAACAGHIDRDARPPEGTRAFLNMTDDQVNALALHDYEKAFWRTFDRQHFGGTIVDTTWPGGNGMNPIFQRDDFRAVAREAGVAQEAYSNVPIGLGGIDLRSKIRYCANGTC